MKKVLCIIGLVLVTVSFQSCTDGTEQLQENAKFEQQLIEHEEVGNDNDDDEFMEGRP